MKRLVLAISIVVAVGAVVTVALVLRRGGEGYGAGPRGGREPGPAITINARSADTDFSGLEPEESRPASAGNPVVAGGGRTSMSAQRQVPATGESSAGSVVVGMQSSIAPRANDGQVVTEEDRQRLLKERMAKAMQDMRYYLPSRNVVRQLGRTTDPGLQLTEGQEKTIESIDEEMRGSIDDRLKDLWAQREAVGDQLRALYRAGRKNEAGPLNEQYRTIYREEMSIRRELDERYKNLLSKVLTAEQMSVLTGPLTPMQTQRLYGYSPYAERAVPVQKPAQQPAGQ